MRLNSFRLMLSKPSSTPEVPGCRACLSLEPLQLATSMASQVLCIHRYSGRASSANFGSEIAFLFADLKIQSSSTHAPTDRTKRRLRRGNAMRCSAMPGTKHSHAMLLRHAAWTKEPISGGSECCTVHCQVGEDQKPRLMYLWFWS